MASELDTPPHILRRQYAGMASADPVTARKPAVMFRPMSRLQHLVAVTAALLLPWSQPAAAQDFSNRPVRLMVGFTAGGTTDFVARLLAERLRQGENIALVSDAGVPLISDPGYRLVRAALELRIEVQPVPGPSAALAALSASGLPTDSFHFGGFLPAKAGPRARVLEALAGETATLIFYEAPHRILETLEAIEQLLGPRPVVVARELTKIHEEFLRGTTGEVRAALAAREALKGEITVLIGKAAAPPADSTPIEDAVAGLERAGTPRMDAIKQVARQRGMSKRVVYERLLK